MKSHIPLPVATRRRLENEVRRTISENVKTLSGDVEATFLWLLHEKYGFGEKRLMDFHKDIQPLLNELCNFYETPYDEQAWICRYKLKQIGVDMDKLDCAIKFGATLKDN